MNRKKRRELVRKGKYKLLFALNMTHLQSLLNQRVKFTLKELGIDFYEADGELKGDFENIKRVYNNELGQLQNEFELNKGDIKKLKEYE